MKLRSKNWRTLVIFSPLVLQTRLTSKFFLLGGYFSCYQLTVNVTLLLYSSSLVTVHSHPSFSKTHHPPPIEKVLDGGRLGSRGRTFGSFRRIRSCNKWPPGFLETEISLEQKKHINKKSRHIFFGRVL